MRRWFKNGIRFLFVTGGIIVLTSIGIDASQYLTGSTSALGILADKATEGACPAGMTFVERGTDDFCIDTYEVSVGESCPNPTPGHFSQTATNIQTAECLPESKPNQQPWTQVTYHQANELCAKAGKRLPNQSEWYQAALGTIENACKVEGGAAVLTGEMKSCVSGAGVHDMIGNAWEWVLAESKDGQYDGRTLPETGYVSNADMSGVAIETAPTPQAQFNDDYFWANNSGQFVMMRGGFYGSGKDAGLYSVHSDIDSSFSSGAIGFRCVK